MQTVATSPPPGALVARLDAFAAACLFLSRVLLDAPDGLLLSQLASPDVLQDWPLQDADDRLGIALVSESLGSSSESLQDLYEDHRRIFLGPEHVLACPYESVYLNEEHLTFGSQTLAVRRWYHRYGLRAPAEGREPDDHIGLELGFVSHLCLQALRAAEDNDDEMLSEHCGALGEFLDDHLLRWGNTCLEHVAAQASTSFYRGVGHLGIGVVRALEGDFAG